MTTVTKPFSDFVNNVDVADAVKVNAQLNALYIFLNGTNIDFTNLAAAIYKITATANTLAYRDASGNAEFSLPVTKGQNPNLLFNPNFRLSSSGWRGIGTNGFNLISGGGEGGYLSNQSNIGASGVQVDNVSNLIPAVASAQYTISGEMFASGVTLGSIGLQWYAYDINKTLISGSSVNAINGQSWTRYSLSFTTPANTAYIQVACIMNANTTNTNAAWRKIKVEIGSIITTFSDDNTMNTLQYGSALPLSQVLSGGNKVESGSSSAAVATAGTAVTVTVTFPVAFAAAPTVEVGLTTVSVGDAGYVTVRVSAKTATSVTFTINSYVAQTVGFDYTTQGT